MNKYISIQESLTVTIIVGIFFIALGYLNSKKTSNNKNYIVGDRNENTFSLTASLTASALGAWILFGPASAATWGGVGAVIGYALGTATPMLFLYNFGPKIRKEFPNGLTLNDFIKKRPTITVTANDVCADMNVFSMAPLLNYRSGSSGIISVF